MKPSTSKSKTEAAKKLPQVSDNHPEFAAVKECFNPSLEAPNGTLPISTPPAAMPAPQTAPEHLPTPAGAVDLVVTGDKRQPLIAGENQPDQGSPAVSENVSEIKRLHEENWGHARSTFDNGLRIGELLVAEKKRCGHDNWLAFVRDNLPFGERTARNYMRIFKQKEKVLKSENVSDLIVTRAYGLLRKPRQRKPRTGSDEPKILNVDAQVVQTGGSPGSSKDPVDTPSSHDAGTAGDAADNKSGSPASQAGVVTAPLGVVAGGGPDGSAADHGNAAAAGPSAHGSDGHAPTVPISGKIDTEATGGSKLAEFVLADGSKCQLPWFENRALSVAGIEGLLRKIKSDNEDPGTSYGYSLESLVKFQHRVLSTTAFVVVQLGASPTSTDLEMIRNAMTDIRDLLPTR